MNFKRYTFKALTNIGGEIYERMNATNREDTQNEFCVWSDMYNSIRRELDRRTLKGEPNEEIRRAIEDKQLRHYEVAEFLGMSESAFCRLLRKQITPEQKAEILKSIEGMRV